MLIRFYNYSTALGFSFCGLATAGYTILHRLYKHFIKPFALVLELSPKFPKAPAPKDKPSSSTAMPSPPISSESLDQVS
jgi:hypothetical protein